MITDNQTKHLCDYTMSECQYLCQCKFSAICVTLPLTLITGKKLGKKVGKVGKKVFNMMGKKLDKLGKFFGKLAFPGSIIPI